MIFTALLHAAVFAALALPVVAAEDTAAAPAAPAITFVKAWGQKGAADGQFDAPIGIAINGKDEIYITDFRNDRVQKFDAEGKFLGKFAVEDKTPGGIAVDRHGAIYVALMMAHKICVYDDSGKLLRQWSQKGKGDGELDQPGGLAVAGDTLYVADQVNRRIQRFTLAGEFLGKWGEYGTRPGQFDGTDPLPNRTGGPNLVAIDAAGYVYTTEARIGRIQKFTPEGKPLLAFGSNSTEPSGFGGRPQNLPGPIAIALDKQGRIWVSSTNHRVQVFSPDGKFIGGFTSLEASDAPGRFHTPHGLAFDSHGDLFVVDAQNERVQKFHVDAPPAK
ncbi:MAG TPA: SMP-30/gluconolactonase/LRE family protein [Planctomycetota bacterium]|nr:SMP-30/gluconolactonase/LRE family protein [Planctomycetota bacterium]